MSGWRKWLWIVVGGLMLAGGIVNFFGLGEDMPTLFGVMADANQGTRLALLSDWIAAHPGLAIMPVAAFMAATGLAELLRWKSATLRRWGSW